MYVLLETIIVKLIYYNDFVWVTISNMLVFSYYTSAGTSVRYRSFKDIYVKNFTDGNIMLNFMFLYCRKKGFLHYCTYL